MKPSIRKPVPRWKVLLGTLVLAGALAGIAAGADALRYTGPPLVTPGASQPEPAADPRTPVTCADPIPREGQERRPSDSQAPAERVTSSQLYDCPQTYDDRRVRYEGEVVGAVLRRNEGAWVQLNDDVYAGDIGPLPAHRDFRGGNGGVGVFVPHDLADQISTVGGPRARGDIISVTGVFHRVDEATGEVAIVRASEGTVAAGEPITRPLNPARRLVAVIMVVVTLAVLLLERRFRPQD